MSQISSFIHPISHYRGKFTPNNLVVNANLQEFAQRVSLISGLASNGKISLDQALNDIEILWQELKKTA
ncbi:MAG: hypothetical protein F6K10_02125 [Moorea sp. SIO2B7]|nr:hypothetical protein [Moorena sp. SIO2B7]